MSPPYVSFLCLFPPDISCLLFLSYKVRPYLSLEMILRFSLVLVAPGSCTSYPEKKRAYRQSNIKSRSLWIRDLSLCFVLDVVYLQRNFRLDIFYILFNLQLFTADMFEILCSVCATHLTFEVRRQKVLLSLQPRSGTAIWLMQTSSFFSLGSGKQHESER